MVSKLAAQQSWATQVSDSDSYIDIESESKSLPVFRFSLNYLLESLLESYHDCESEKAIILDYNDDCPNLNKEIEILKLNQALKVGFNNHDLTTVITDIGSIKGPICVLTISTAQARVFNEIILDSYSLRGNKYKKDFSKSEINLNFDPLKGNNNIINIKINFLQYKFLERKFILLLFSSACTLFLLRKINQEKILQIESGKKEQKHIRFQSVMSCAIFYLQENQNDIEFKKIQFLKTRRIISQKRTGSLILIQILLILLILLIFLRKKVKRVKRV